LVDINSTSDAIFRRGVGLRGWFSASIATETQGMTHNPPKPLTPSNGSSAKTVLVVEDNDLNRKLFHDLLETKGVNILQAKDGMEALELARTHHPDLIIMDIQLPEVSGLEVTKWIKESEDMRSIPIIAVTAFAMKGDDEKILEGGCEEYMSKPISVATFLATVARFLN
jgi:two-component system cell cycle response regulator DivK